MGNGHHLGGRLTSHPVPRARPGGYRLETDLCADFVDAAVAGGWTAYPEQGGWDVLLVRRGVQVGVQAKLVGGVEVLLQASEPRGGWKRPKADLGPHYRAALVARFPGRTEAAAAARRREVYGLAVRLRVVVFEPPTRFHCWCRVGNATNVARDRSRSALDLRWYRRRPREPVWTPPFVPDLPAGVPNPRTVSPWSIAAVRLDLLIRERGWVCLDDVRGATAEVGGDWNPKTLLGRYWRSTPTPVGNATGQLRWKPKDPRWTAAPSDEFPHVAAELIGVRKRPRVKKVKR